MEKTGKCLRCGSCCKFKNLWFSLATKEKIGLYERLGEQKIQKMFKKNVNCPYLARTLGGYKCLIYETRPKFCQDYPGNKNELLPDCGFKFE